VIAQAALAGGTWSELRHVWHEDRGFRKTEILDRAILAAAGDYLVFSDGDCIPRPDFVSTHRRLAQRGRFLSGGYVRLPAEVSEAVEPEDVRAGWIWKAGELRRRGLRGWRSRLRMLAPGALPAVLDRVTPTRATWNGMSASTWKDAILEVNGFDLDLTYGGLDRELGQRLENLGLKGVQVRHRAVLLHLHHDRPYRDPVQQERQRALRLGARKSGRTRAARGLAELPRAATTPPWEISQ
jgi:hypothetical protein